MSKSLNMNKLLICSFLAIGLLLGCKKKEKEPLEYFSFTANGVDYYYPQIKGTAFVGNWKTLGAGSMSGNMGFLIRARSEENPAIPGEFRFTFFPGDQIPQQDTIILDNSNAWAEIENFINMGNNFNTNGSYSGKLIFTVRSEDMLSGTFEFEAQQQYNDSILHITNGKFSIIPTLQNE